MTKNPRDAFDPPDLGRRALLRGATLGSFALEVGTFGNASAKTRQPGAPAARELTVELTVNQRTNRLTLDSRSTLLEALRNQLGLTGTKKGCDHGQCGACTVHVGGKRVLACLTLTAMVRDPVTTIEGLASPDGTLHPMQQAFIEHDAFQCGYCTPGQIMSAIGCVKEGHATDADAIRESMSGNLCRCAAYPHIVAAIEQAAPHAT